MEGRRALERPVHWVVTAASPSPPARPTARPRSSRWRDASFARSPPRTTPGSPRCDSLRWRRSPFAAGRHRDPRLHGQAAGLSARARATRRSSGSTADRSGSSINDFANLDWQVFAAQGYVVARREPAGQLGPGREVLHRDLRGLGREGWRGRARRGGLGGRGRASPIPSVSASAGWSYGGILTNQVIARDRRFKAATSGAGQGNALVGYGTDMYTHGVRGRAGEAVGEPGDVAAGVVALPARGPHRDADALPLRRRGLERPPHQLGADVPGPQEPRPGDAAHRLPGRVPWDRATQRSYWTGWTGILRGTESTSAAPPRRRAPGAAREDGA